VFDYPVLRVLPAGELDRMLVVGASWAVGVASMRGKQNILDAEGESLEVMAASLIIGSR
jgi:hypothetical protein